MRADLPFACKGGVCGTCRARLVEGTVQMDANYALEPDEIEKGYVLTCQSHPTSAPGRARLRRLTEVLLDALVETHLAWFFLHDSDDRFGVLPDEGESASRSSRPPTACAILLGDEDGSDEVPVRVRVLRERGSADGRRRPGVRQDPVPVRRRAGRRGRVPLDPDTCSSWRGPGRVPVRLFLDLTTSPPAVTVVLGELVPDRSVLPPVPLRERLGRWFRSRS